ncbi:MAG: T9SS type A sorting domain-containing protein [Calditrichaeota bacterium]|nr:T9SS type A sorting domain-containing protein [Calditrichota bacterium]
MKKNCFVVIIFAFCLSTGNLPAQDFFGINRVGMHNPVWSSGLSGASNGDTLYYVQGGVNGVNCRIRLVDCHDPDNIRELGQFPLDGLNFNCMKARDDLVFICHSSGMRIIRIDEDVQPHIISDFDLEAGITTIELWGEYAMLGSGDGRFLVINISNLERPRLIATRDLGFEVTQIKTSGQIACLSGERFVTVNLEDPEEPQIIQTINRAGLDLEIIGEIACIASGEDGIRFYDISDPSDPFETGHLRNTSYRLEQLDGLLLSGYEITREEFWGEQDYVVYDVSNCYLIDVSNPFVPELITGIFWCSGNLFTIVNGMIAQYYSDPGSGTRLVFHAINDENRYVEIDYLISPAGTGYIGADDNYMYSLNGGIVVLDKSNPERPEEISRIEIGRTYRFCLENEIIYYFDKDERRFGSVNIEDPQRPDFYRFNYQPQVNPIYGFSVSNNHIFAVSRGDDHAGMLIIPTDVQDPREIYIELDVKVHHEPAIVDDFVYVPAREDGVVIVDASEIDSPRIVRQLEFPAEVWNLDAEGDILCVADGNLNIFNIEDRGNPELISVFDPPDTTDEINIIGNMILMTLASRSGFGDNLPRHHPRLFLVDISDPTNPIGVGHCRTYDIPRNFIMEMPYIYSAEGCGLAIYDCSEAYGIIQDQVEFTPETSMLYPAYPNPFNGLTSLKYQLTKPATVQIGIFDNHGRQVLDVANHQLKYPGLHTEIINANSLPSGSYYAFLKAGDLQEVAPLILVK